MKKKTKIITNCIVCIAVLFALILIFESLGMTGSYYRRPTCIPNCMGRQCGSNGCGGSCGGCSYGYTCSGTRCIKQCTPNCAGKQCGSNGCGGSCGSCSYGYTCSGVKCIQSCFNECSSGSKQCVSSTSFKICGNYDSDSCLEYSGSIPCSSDYICSSGNCMPNKCPDGTFSGQCSIYKPKQCISGNLIDNCKACGCSTDQSCTSTGVCVKQCTQNCAGKQCGSNGCGGSCGSCPTDQNCKADGTCEIPAPICGNNVIDATEKCDGGTGCTNCVCDTNYTSTTPVSVNCESIPQP